MSETHKCPVCAFETSIGDERCALCGTRLNSRDHRPSAEGDRAIDIDPDATSEHLTVSGLFSIMLMSLIGTVAGGIAGFFGGIAAGWVAFKVLSFGLSSLIEMVFGPVFFFFYKEAPIILFFSFFETMLVFGCYTGGSLGKASYLSRKLGDSGYSTDYSNFFRRLFREWAYSMAGLAINVHLFIIMDAMTRGSIAGRNRLILITQILIVFFTLFAIRLARMHHKRTRY